MIILVTGGAGFVGLNLLRQLLRLPDCDVRILDNFSNSTPERIAHVVAETTNGAGRVRVIRADVADAGSLRGAADGVYAVIHLAAQTGTAPSLADPRGDLVQNVVGTFNMLEACRTSGVRRFVLASSAAVLGNVPPPQHEELPLRPLSPYGASKAAAEAYCTAYHTSFGIETIALRFSNVYGPLSWSKGSVIAKFLKQVLAGERLVVNGDGMQTRDFLYVEDLAHLLVAAARAPLDPTLLGSPCNVATGVQTRIVDLARAFRAEFGARGRACDFDFGPPLPSDPTVSAPATGRLKRFFPDIAFRGLEEGLSATIDWFLVNWPLRAELAGT